MANQTTHDQSNNVELHYAPPERPRREQLITLLLLMSLVHFFGLRLLVSVLRPTGAAREWLLYLLAFPFYHLVKLGWPVPLDPSLWAGPLMLLTSLLYGAVLTAIYLMIRRLLKK